jgi:hypothetical protein
MKSIASFISRAVFVVVPWSRSEAARLASPALSLGSSEAPARTIIRMLTTGCSW